MHNRKSSREHIHGCLARIRAAGVTGAPANDEWVAALQVFDASLCLHEPAVVQEACRRWAEDQPRWPSLSALLDECRRLERLRAPAQRPLPAHQPSERPVEIRDLPGMLATIAELRAHPERYVAAEALAAIGEAMVERWHEQQRTEMAA